MNVSFRNNIKFAVFKFKLLPVCFRYEGIIYENSTEQVNLPTGCKFISRWQKLNNILRCFAETFKITEQRVLIFWILRENKHIQYFSNYKTFRTLCNTVTWKLASPSQTGETRLSECQPRRQHKKYNRLKLRSKTISFFSKFFTICGHVFFSSSLFMRRIFNSSLFCSSQYNT